LAQHRFQSRNMPASTALARSCGLILSISAADTIFRESAMTKAYLAGLMQYRSRQACGEHVHLQIVGSPNEV
jgi:hypothetical protein